MNVVVMLKQVPDTETKIRITADKSGIEKGDIKWIINPYDEYAIEEGLKIKEGLKAGTVTVVTMGPDRCVEALRTAIAMGADNAIHIKEATEASDPFVIAQALSAAIKKENPEIVLCGKQAIDDDGSAVSGYVAELLNIPSVSVVVKIAIGPDKKDAKAEREVEGGAKHVVHCPLPALFAVNKGINTPRYASLPGIMKAKKKEIKTYSLQDLGVTAAATMTEAGYELPPERKAGKKIAGDTATQATELARLLREEAKVI